MNDERLVPGRRSLEEELRRPVEEKVERGDLSRKRLGLKHEPLPASSAEGAPPYLPSLREKEGGLCLSVRMNGGGELSFQQILYNIEVLPAFQQVKEEVLPVVKLSGEESLGDEWLARDSFLHYAASNFHARTYGL